MGSSLVGACSGVMVSPEHAITAAHCVSIQHNRVVVAPGQYWDSYPFGMALARKSTIMPCFAETDTCDVAVLTLDRPIGVRSQYLPYREFDENEGTDFTVAAYAGEKILVDHGVLYQRGDFLHHRMFTVMGMSGGPFLLGRTVVGICTKFGTISNVAIPFTKAHVEFIDSVVSE